MEIVKLPQEYLALNVLLLCTRICCTEAWVDTARVDLGFVSVMGGEVPAGKFFGFSVDGTKETVLMMEFGVVENIHIFSLTSYTFFPAFPISWKHFGLSGIQKLGGGELFKKCR